MAILVTGAGGFVGRALIARLLADGQPRVIALDRTLEQIGDHPKLIKLKADLTDIEGILKSVNDPIDAVIHLAAVPGGAAEGDPGLSRRVNVDAALDLINAAAARGQRPRFVFASTIAVFGEDLPEAGVDDATPLSPHLIYGMHKAMMETAIATMSRRGAIDGISLRLPGILARPAGPSGMKSAFMSDVFHAFRAGKACTMPVSPQAQMWMMSVTRCVDNLVHALSLDTAKLPDTRAVTLPALRVSMADYVAALATAFDGKTSAVTYAPDAALEAAFGAYPPLTTSAAEKVGLRHDGSVDAMVGHMIATCREAPEFCLQ